jgi:hypothetical protein
MEIGAASSGKVTIQVPLRLVLRTAGVTLQSQITRERTRVFLYIYAEYRDNHLIGARNSMLMMFNGTPHSPWNSIQERRREHGHAECRVELEGYFYDEEDRSRYCRPKVQ